MDRLINMLLYFTALSIPRYDIIDTILRKIPFYYESVSDPVVHSVLQRMEQDKNQFILHVKDPCPHGSKSTDTILRKIPFYYVLVVHSESVLQWMEQNKTNLC